MRSPLFLLLMSTLAASAAEPVEVLGGYPVYGAGMPRSGLVVPLGRAIERLPEEVAGARKITGTLQQQCGEAGCRWALADNSTHARIEFDVDMPESSTNAEAIVFGVLRKSQDSPQPPGREDYYIVATSVMVKPEG